MKIHIIGNFILSAILYTSYNSLILVPMLINFKKYKLNNLKICIIGIITAFILFLLMLLIYNANNLFYPEIMSAEMPNMILASLINPGIKLAYGIVMLAAIFTTAFSCGFSFLEMCKKENYERNALFICGIAFLCAKIGFSTMINYCFPIFGYIGIFQIILIIISLKNKEGRK